MPEINYTHVRVNGPFWANAVRSSARSTEPSRAFEVPPIATALDNRGIKILTSHDRDEFIFAVPDTYNGRSRTELLSDLISILTNA